MMGEDRVPAATAHRHAKGTGPPPSHSLPWHEVLRNWVQNTRNQLHWSMMCRSQGNS